MALINKLSAIGNAIREKTGKTDLLTLDQMPQEISSIETGSGSIDYMSYVSSVRFSSAISEITDNIYLDLSNAITLSNFLNRQQLYCNRLTAKVTNLCTNFQQSFMNSFNNSDGCKELEIIGDTSQVTIWNESFRNNSYLMRIIGELDFSNGTTMNNMFMNDTRLEEIYPKAGTIKLSFQIGHASNLTDESIQAIINGLADLTDSTAQTLTLHATVKAKLTETQIASITSKNWTLA